MGYGPYTKHEFYGDVLTAWNDAKNETHSDVVNALLNDKYSWENLKSYYQSKYPSPPFPETEAKDAFDDDFGLRGSSGQRFWGARETPAMMQKVTGAVRAMRQRNIHLPPKQKKHEVDFASLRCA